MTQILNQLATIEFNDEILERLDLTGIYDSFRKNYRKLDDLKNARSEHEERNALMRWWHNDKLQEAQLDSTEVQAEFSKAIGQLMLISVMQSKRLVEQQTQLKTQQGKLKAQADGIAQQASQLQLQHHRLADQSTKLENLVREYFELKGLTDDGAARLIEIAAEVKCTKDDMLQQFAGRMQQVDDACINAAREMASLSSELNAQLYRHEERAQSAIEELQLETRKHFAATESILREQQHAALVEITAGVALMEQGRRALEDSVLANHTKFAASLSAVSRKVEQCDEAAHEQSDLLQKELHELGVRTSSAAIAQSNTEAELTSCNEKQERLLESFKNYRNEVSARFARLSYVCAGLGLGFIGSLAGVMHLLK